MVRKKIFGLALVLSLFSLSSVAFLYAVENLENREIPSRLEELKERKKANQIEEEKRETGGQGAAIADWRRYAQDIEAVRQLEIENRALQKEIEKLEKPKTDL